MGEKPEGQHDRGLTAAPLARLRPTAALRADVGIVGAGPAGLLIANLLQQRGIDSIVVDKFTREQIHSRARAGFIEWRNRILLERVGLADRMLAEGSAHGECEFRTVEGSYVLDYAALAGGRTHWVYPQQELVSDLTDSFLAGGGDIRFGLACVDVHRSCGAGRAVRGHDHRRADDARVSGARRLRRLSRSRSRLDPRRSACGPCDRPPVPVADDPGGGPALLGARHLRRSSESALRPT